MNDFNNWRKTNNLGRENELQHSFNNILDDFSSEIMQEYSNISENIYSKSIKSVEEKIRETANIYIKTLNDKEIENTPKQIDEKENLIDSIAQKYEQYEQLEKELQSLEIENEKQDKPYEI